MKMKRMRRAKLWIYMLLLVMMSLAVGATLGSTFTNSSGEKSFREMMDEAMTSMDRGMQNTPMTGNPDHDFAVIMISHHQGAIDMARAELLYGKDAVLRRLAQGVIVTQQQEIEVMRMRLKELKTR